MFDIVILVGPKDESIIKKQLEYTKKNVIGYRNIYLIPYKDSIEIDGCITISEKLFPFSIETVSFFHGKNTRNGWYFQQLLKLYAGFIIPSILERYLVIDCDTFFLRQTTFISDDNKCLYNFGSEHNKLYFIHMQKMNENFVKVFKNKSGICHHMIFETKYIQEIIDIIEKSHNDKFYNVFLNKVEKNCKVGASEYEIYFNYVMKNHTQEVKLRNLKFNINTRGELNESSNDKFDYVSCHWYSRSKIV